MKNRIKMVVIRRDDFLREDVFESILRTFHDKELSDYHAKRIDEVTISDAILSDYEVDQEFRMDWSLL